MRVVSSFMLLCRTAIWQRVLRPSPGTQRSWGGRRKCRKPQADDPPAGPRRPACRCMAQVQSWSPKRPWPRSNGRSAGASPPVPPAAIQHGLLALMLLTMQGSWVAAKIPPPPLGGEPTRGLQVSAQPAQTTWVLGKPITLEATLTNVGETPVLVDLFGDLHELYEGKRRDSYVTSCWALVWEPMAAPAVARRPRYTLEPAQFQRLAPGESSTKTLSLTLAGVSPGTYEVRVAYVPRMSSPSFSLPDHWETQHGFHDPMWRGMAFSNPVQIIIVE